MAVLSNQERPYKGTLGSPNRVTCMSHFGCFDQYGETLERVPQDGSYRSRALTLLGACTYNSTGMKYAPITLCTIENGRVSGAALNSEYQGRELNLHLTVNMCL